MELTETQWDLVDGLRAFGIKDSGIPAILTLLISEEAQNRMIDWMLDHEKASTQEIINKAIELRGQYGD